MRHIMVMNAKGGSGKSTIATNVAAYYAKQGKKVALADYDPQQSSLNWLERRPASRPEIVGLDAASDGLKHLSRAMDLCVMDAPARTVGSELTQLVNHADTILVPVLPSTIDMDPTRRL